MRPRDAGVSTLLTFWPYEGTTRSGRTRAHRGDESARHRAASLNFADSPRIRAARTREYAKADGKARVEWQITSYGLCISPVGLDGYAKASQLYRFCAGNLLIYLRSEPNQLNNGIAFGPKDILTNLQRIAVQTEPQTAVSETIRIRVYKCKSQDLHTNDWCEIARFPIISMQILHAVRAFSRRRHICRIIANVTATRVRNTEPPGYHGIIPTSHPLRACN